MPAIWSSSERPISVRTVWVDGIRHAILSPDDPLINSDSRGRPRVSRSRSYSTDYQQLESRLDRLNSCFTNLQMIVSNNSAETKTPSKVYRKLSAPPCPRTFSGASDASTLDSLLGNNIKIQRKYRGRREWREGANCYPDKRFDKSNICESRMSKRDLDDKLNVRDCRQANGESDTFWDPLFERVFQWLDLSGRTQSYDFVDDFPRRSSCDENRKGKLPRLKRDSLEERERMAEQKYKLNKDSVPECFQREENKVSQQRLPKIKNVKQQLGDDDEGRVVSLPYDLNDGRTPSQLEEEIPRNEVKEKASSTIWPPPGRMKLHVVIPSFVCRESHMSSQESLIND